MPLRHAVTIASLAVALTAGRASAEPRGPCDPLPARGTLGTICGFSRPEDVEVVVPAGIMLVSEMAPLRDGGSGSLAAVTLESLGTATPEIRRLWPPAGGTQGAGGGAPTGDPSCTGPPAPAGFSPHGISAAVRPDGTVGVAVVGHGSREAIELFDLEASGRAARLTWRGCVPLAEGTTANDLALLPDGGLVVANYAPAFGGTRGMAWMIAARLGLDTGDVLEWSRRSGWRHVPGTAARGANGIAVSAGRESWFTESGAQRIGRIGAAKEGEAPDVTRAPIEGAPDNLAWTGRGTLLTTTHLSPLGFLACAFGRLPCRASWQLVEIDPRTLATSVLLRHDGSVVGAVSSAAEYEGRYYLGAVFDDRIGVWAPAP